MSSTAGGRRNDLGLAPVAASIGAPFLSEALRPRTGVCPFHGLTFQAATPTRFSFTGRWTSAENAPTPTPIHHTAV